MPRHFRETEVRARFRGPASRPGRSCSFLFLLLASFFLSACAEGPENDPASVPMILSNEPSANLAVEEFNALHPYSGLRIRQSLGPAVEANEIEPA